MAEGKLLVGNVEVLALTDNAGDFPIRLSHLFPTTSADAWAPFRQRYPELFNGPDIWRNHYGCYLLRSQAHPGHAAEPIWGISGEWAAWLKWTS